MNRTERMATTFVDSEGVTSLNYYKGQEVDAILGEERVVGVKGRIGNTRIVRTYPDGSKSTTTWDGMVEVEAGDRIVIDSAGRITVGKKRRK